jgi:hypothetical protein
MIFYHEKAGCQVFCEILKEWMDYNRWAEVLLI